MIFRIKEASALSEEQRNIVNDDFAFFVKRMFGFKERSKLDIELVILDKLIPDVAGQTLFPKGDTYVVELAKQYIGGPFWLDLLAHELVHVRQLLRGRMKFQGTFNEGCIMWLGKVYSPNVYGYTGNGKISYTKIPWEAEACKLAREWAIRYESFFKRCS